MQTIFDACEPRSEVLHGELKEEVFAARLKDVIDGSAEAVYQDPQTFFENTYPTDGLKALLEEALGRLTGQRSSSNPIIRLETSFGGGKTHNLIALYHAARGSDAARTSVDRSLIPAPGEIRIAGVVGSDLDPSSGLLHRDVTTYTLWGELAYQLGGLAAYQLVAESDRNTKAAPGTGVWQQIVGDQPALIMLDEVARHLRSAKAVPTGTGRSDLAEQTVAFLMSLLEFAASRERVVVVLTLADSSDAFGAETDELREALREELAEARRVSARQERVITPTGETEIAKIVTHRLFRSIRGDAAEAVTVAYHQYYAQLLEQQADLPQRAGRADYAGEMRAAYPFHPELLNTLNRKTSTIPNFQKTRGALRLLAMTIRRLWETRPADTYLIHPHHLDLAVPQIADDLTSRLDRPAFKQVIEADIASSLPGTRSHAQTIDTAWVAAGKPPYAQRVATTIFLHSLTQGIASGVDPADLRLAVVQPGDDPTLIDRATERLVDACWFLDYNGHRYQFKTEPSINKVVADEMSVVGTTRAKALLDERIRQVWRRGVFQPVYFPSEASEVDDDAREPKLVVIHYDAAAATASDPAPPDFVRRIFEYAGSREGYRVYKNNLIFLVADRDQVSDLVEQARRYLAIGRIIEDTDRLQAFTEEQRRKLRQLRDSAELELRVAITRAYRYLYYPSGDAPRDAANLAREVLPAQDQGEVRSDQSTVVLRVLKQIDKVRTADDPPMAAQYVKAKAWDVGQDQMTTEDLRRAFAKRLSLPMLLDVNQLKRAIRDGIQQGLWVYFDPHENRGYGQVSPPPSVQLSDDVALFTPEEARRRHIAIRGEEVEPVVERCPVCGQPTDQCICGDVISPANWPPPPPPPVVTLPLKAEGAPAQVFQAISDTCLDKKIDAIRSLTIHLEGDGPVGAAEVRALGLAVPQLGKGQFRVEQVLTIEFGQGEYFHLTFNGSWDRYKRLRTVTDEFGKEAAKLTIRTTLQATFPDGLAVDSDQFGQMRDIFDQLGFGRLTVKAEPVTEDTEVLP
ncbi:MAG: DUF499 domain-containing protein [Sphaerobacter sp.]|nr:DUF499 domain-containing protein [Sphaerobacter sp.]